MQLIAIQLTSNNRIECNLAEIDRQLAQIDFSVPSLVLLPENFAMFGCTQEYQQAAEFLGQGPIQAQLSAWAKQYRCWLVAGSFPIKVAGEKKVYTTSLAFDPEGGLIQYYNKLHLFDVAVSGAGEGAERESYRESDSFMPGDQLATFVAGKVKVGMAICYDLRFPELFRLLRQQGVDILLLPAAFTRTTGRAHWLPLLQARAIENQCYLIAANQTGTHHNGRKTWGNSVILDPWGEILAQQEQGVGAICAEFDSQKLAQIRTDMPILQHARFTASLK